MVCVSSWPRDLQKEMVTSKEKKLIARFYVGVASLQVSGSDLYFFLIIKKLNLEIQEACQRAHSTYLTKEKIAIPSAFASVGHASVPENVRICVNFMEKQERKGPTFSPEVLLRLSDIYHNRKVWIYPERCERTWRDENLRRFVIDYHKV